MTVSERIFDLLKKQGKKQGDLARALNVRPTTVSEWKTGKREPSAVFYAKIAEYFGVSLDYLITGRPPRDAPVQQIIGNNNSNNIANVAGNVGGDLTEYERELLKVCESFDMRHKTALLQQRSGVHVRVHRQHHDRKNNSEPNVHADHSAGHRRSERTHRSAGR